MRDVLELLSGEGEAEDKDRGVDGKSSYSLSPPPTISAAVAPTKTGFAGVAKNSSNSTVIIATALLLTLLLTSAKYNRNQPLKHFTLKSYRLRNPVSYKPAVTALLLERAKCCIKA